MHAAPEGRVTHAAVTVLPRIALELFKAHELEALVEKKVQAPARARACHRWHHAAEEASGAFAAAACSLRFISTEQLQSVGNAYLSRSRLR